MGGLFSSCVGFLHPKDPGTPVKGILPRITNVAKNNYRGLVGFFVPLFLLSWQGKKGEHHLTVQCMWLMMFWFFLWQPVNVPVTALVPIFVLPMAGVMSSVATCRCYMNENVVLFILTGMLILLLNNSGADRRIALWLLCSGDACQFSGRRMIFKCTTAAFFLSMFSSRLIVTSTLIEFMTPPLMALQAANADNKADADFNEVRYIICQSIQTASSIGSIAIPHSALATLAFRAMYYESPPKGKEYPDIFNYFQYCVYAFPVAILMNIVNFAYHILLLTCYGGKRMSSGSMAQLKSDMLKYKEDIPKKITLHEVLSILFAVLYLIAVFTRWSRFLSMGWGDFRAEKTSPEIPGMKDATVAAIFVILLHTLPKGFGFLQYFKSGVESPPTKPESAILFWRFVDKNLNYGYIFMLGCGVAITCAARDSGLGQHLSANFGKKISDYNFEFSVTIVCMIAVFLANIMSGVAACAVWLPFILNMTLGPDAPAVWQTRTYIGALGVGVGSSFGFMFPFLFTPAYFCHYTGKVPIDRMASYGIMATALCMGILSLSLHFWAPYVFDPNDVGIVWVDAPVLAGATTTTTPAPDFF